jgi:hypothetical protein
LLALGSEYRTNRADGKPMPRTTGEFVEEFHRSDTYQDMKDAMSPSTPVEAAFEGWADFDKAFVQNEFAIPFTDALRANVARSFTLLKRDAVGTRNPTPDDTRRHPTPRT